MKVNNINPNIEAVIASLNIDSVSEERKTVLDPLTAFIQKKVDAKQPVYINMICTHNSRRSHLSQVWAQTISRYLGVDNVFCYSGGTEATAMAPRVGKTLEAQGFEINTLSEGKNPVYAVKYDSNSMPIICFSKRYDDDFNAKSDFAAIMTCSQADGGCPFVVGCEERLAITFEDPKAFDGTDLEIEKYKERSIQIATEMLYVFKNVTK